MNAQKIALKLYLADPSALQHGAMVPVFHSWIQTHAVEDHLPVDVTDYEHVPDGPGTVLITHEANFSMDSTAGRPGLMYQRKQPLHGDFKERLATIFRHTLLAAARLESHPGLKFRTDELTLKIVDRLLAPNTVETFTAVKPALDQFFKSLYGNTPVTQKHNAAAPDKLFEVTIESPQTSATISDLLAKLPAPAAA
jgi:hypothetical protein